MILNHIGDVIIAWEDYKKDAVLVHGCNCMHTMGAGIAHRIRKLYPEAYDADLYTPMGDKKKLGTYSRWGFPDIDNYVNKIIVNAYTQYDYGGLTRNVDYDALERVMIKINNDFPKEQIFMPRIGCGLAGGDWDVVKEILDKVFKDRIIYVYTLS